ncbi:NAD-dependent epimerase/dehydratase family protein [Paenibacillus monticola]|uniref:NAD-dependent epimerase/dehydratase family protein n=1 Tax=Paenibacillus monticola TaxID=2666075 RepID=A0A7X2L477_9BACL|nr:NAD-dependent epimerase/dehydratase family protein [Paenibacillus monticola]MRN56065.1 NAD-dependent epimerase/dehydratase family protein [Paenibacillus monticola]
MSGRRLLITGAAGFTGRHAVNYFSAAGAEVTAVVRCATNLSSSAASGISAVSAAFPDDVQIYYCDLSDRQAVNQMIKEMAPEEVLHLAGKNSVPESWNNPLLYMETNVIATLYLLEGMRSLPASRILVAGSRLKYRPGLAAGPPHPYSLSKTLEELISLAWGTLFKQQVLLAEPCNLIGPGPSTGFCSLLAQHIVRSEAVANPDSSSDSVTSDMLSPFRLSSRSALRDFLDVRDCITAYDYILRKGENGTIYRIDSGTQRQLGEIAEKLLKQSTATVPMDWGQDSGDQQEVNPVKPAALPSATTPEADVTTLGWKPEIKLTQSLTDILEYYRASKEGRPI